MYKVGPRAERVVENWRLGPYGGLTLGQRRSAGKVGKLKIVIFSSSNQSALLRVYLRGNFSYYRPAYLFENNFPRLASFGAHLFSLACGGHTTLFSVSMPFCDGPYLPLATYVPRIIRQFPGNSRKSRLFTCPEIISEMCVCSTCIVYFWQQQSSLVNYWTAPWHLKLIRRYKITIFIHACILHRSY